MEFNSRPVNDYGPSGPVPYNSALNLHEITENIEEYYRQKAPNLWNAWIRTNNMLVELSERYDKLENTLNTIQNNMKIINDNVVTGGKNDVQINDNVLNFKKEINEKIDKLDNNISRIKDYIIKQNSADKKLSR